MAGTSQQSSVLAKLCARGKIEVRTDGNILEESDLEHALRNTHGHGNVLLEPQADFNASQVRRLKEFYEDFLIRHQAAVKQRYWVKIPALHFRN